MLNKNLNVTIGKIYAIGFLLGIFWHKQFQARGIATWGKVSTVSRYEEEGSDSGTGRQLQKTKAAAVMAEWSMLSDGDLDVSSGGKMFPLVEG